MYGVVEIDRKEIVAIAKSDKWNSVKAFLKNIVESTLHPQCGYAVVAFDAIINGKNDPDFSCMISEKVQLHTIDIIDDFTMISLQQYNDEMFTNDQVIVTKESGIIVVIAKYMGPDIDRSQNFDFSIQVDSENLPSFTVFNGGQMSPPSFLDLIEKIPVQKAVSKRSGRPPKKKGTYSSKKTVTDISTYASTTPPAKTIAAIKLTPIDKKMTVEFGRIVGKNAIHNNILIKGYVEWKERMIDEYRNNQGGRPIWKGKLSKAFQEFLAGLNYRD